MLQAGTRLGPYEILGQVGAGGMGEVYRARDTRLDGERFLVGTPVFKSTSRMLDLVVNWPAALKKK